MEHIVYVLGAGFSAPLGLPVVRDFLIKSKDLYSERPDTYLHFRKVFDTLRDLAQAKHYFAVDLFNVEEILSLLEMEDYVAGTRHHRDFVLYMKDVIEAYTPPLATRLSEGSNWYEFVFGPDHKWQQFCTFVASLVRLRLLGHIRGPNLSLAPSRDSTEPVRYSLVSLNYDLVLETALAEVARVSRFPLAFATDEAGGSDDRIALAKIHGSIEPLSIVPPTWNKTARPQVRKAWRLAYSALSSATQIRILGYSLPETDAYFRYLLELGAVRAPHLKAFDVLCLDPTGAVRSRYSQFVTLFRARFKSARLEDYLSELLNQTRSTVDRLPDPDQRSLNFARLEQSHETVFSRPDA